jgi:pimeloyl-ACP methyl ester carboxylesterase
LGRGAISFSEQVKVLSQWISDNYPGQKIHLAGLSYGAALAWGISIRNKDQILKTILINPMPPEPAQHFSLKGMKFFFNIPLGRKFILLYLTTPFGKSFLRRCAEIFRNQHFEKNTRFDSLDGKKMLFVGHIFNNFAWILKTEDWSVWQKALMRWKQSVLLIFDDQDPLFEKPCYSDFCDLIRPEEKIVIRGAGHIAILGLPRYIGQKMSEFLQKEVSFKKVG